MPGSPDPGGAVADPRLRRFTRTERLLHWLLAGTFLVMLVTGVILYSPALAGVVERPVAKEWHLVSSVVLLLGLPAIALVGDRRAVRGTLRDLDRFDRDDLAWLRTAPGRALGGTRPAPPQDRFNAGQKLGAALLGGTTVALFLTGGLLWLAERESAFRIAGAVAAHDVVALVAGVLVVGHVWKAALAPGTRHSMRGMTLGWVRRSWAREHHAKWVARGERERP